MKGCEDCKHYCGTRYAVDDEDYGTVRETSQCARHVLATGRCKDYEPSDKATPAPKSLAPTEAVGNAAMREALNQLRDWALLDINENAIRSDEPNYKKLVDGIVEITNAALAAPARNCDVGTADEQADRFKAFCYANRTPGNECSKECPFNDTSAVCYCQARWAQMPYEEGGDHA